MKYLIVAIFMTLTIQNVFADQGQFKPQKVCAQKLAAWTKEGGEKVVQDYFKAVQMTDKMIQQSFADRLPPEKIAEIREMILNFAQEADKFAAFLDTKMAELAEGSRAQKYAQCDGDFNKFKDVFTTVAVQLRGLSVEIEPLIAQSSTQTADHRRGQEEDKSQSSPLPTTQKVSVRSE